MIKKLAFVLALALALVPLASNALGLGEIKLHSALNQPLNAEIPVVGATADEISSLHIKLASAGQFQQAGIPESAGLNQLKFKVVPGPNGTASVHITSTGPFREPFLDILIDATWDNGELIREYTVFLNPPNFEATAKPVSAPSAAPTSSQTKAATTLAAPPAAASVTTPAQPVAPTPALPSSAPVSPPATAAVSSSAAPGGHYGPIHRGETLTEIALKLRPQGVTLNQMMIAIYRANPRVFIHNINLMKAGYVLRIPSADDIQAVAVAEANSEVRTQIATWRNGRRLAMAAPAPAAPATTKKPSLTLVAPSAAGKSAENQVPGSGAGGKGVSGAATAVTHAAGEKAPVASSHTGSAAATTAKAPIKVANAGMAAVQAQAGKANQASAAATKITPLKAAKAAAAKPLRKKKFVAPKQSQPAESGGLLSPPTLYIIIALIIIVIALIAVRIIRKRREDASPFGGGGPSSPKGKAGGKAGKATKTPPTETATWDQQETAGSGEAPSASAAGQAESAPVPAADAAVATAATVSAGDESDPAAESDFHMAYGLYDQAAEVLKKGLAQDPGRRDLKMKLLDVYFTAGDREKFLETARSLRHDMGAAPDKDWEKVAIMGHQIAADDALFSGNGAAGNEAPPVSVDIPLESTVSGEVAVPEVDPLAGAFDDVHPVSIPETPAAKPKEESHVIDFELPDIEPAPAKRGTGTKAAAPDKTGKTVATGASTVSADFGTDSQVEFDKALKELSDFVNTNVPVQEDAAPGVKGSSAALSLSADADPLSTGTGSATGTQSGTGAGGETTGLNEIGTKLDLARAYIDMGDTEGAKNILREVLEEGDREQIQEARKLMQKLS